MISRFSSEQYMKAGAICCRQLAFVLDILTSGCSLDIQMERSIRKLDRSLEDERLYWKRNFLSHQWAPVNFYKNISIAISQGKKNLLSCNANIIHFFALQVQPTAYVSEGSFDHMQQKLTLNS